MRRKRRNVLWSAALCGLAAVGLAGVLLILRSVLDRPTPQSIPSTAPTPTLAARYAPAASEVTARTLYPLALERASAWRVDAQLVSARGVWDKTAINLVGRPVEWAYRFYSAQARLLYFVTVKPDGRVAGTQHLRTVNQPPGLPVADWYIDSPAALSNWLNNGGGPFLGSRPGSQVVAQLSVRSAGAAPAWTVVGYDRLKEEYLATTVQAANGETKVISNQQSAASGQ
jgi:hypothetical protein